MRLAAFDWSIRASLLSGSLIALLLLMAGQVLSQVPTDASGIFYLHTGDRVVFYGDSITEQGNYTLPIEIYMATRHPQMDVKFVNSGWGGDRSWGGEGGMLADRLKRDVLAYKPTVVVVMLGMNDGYYTKFDQKALDAFQNSIRDLIKTLQRGAPGVRITLIGTSPYDNVTPSKQPEWEVTIKGGYDAVIARYSQAMGEVAQEYGLLFVDLHQPLVKLLNDLQAQQPVLVRELIPDRIHPGKAAGLVMAARLLDAWNAPSTNDVTIDGGGISKQPLHLRQGLPVRISLDANDPLTRYLAQHGDDLQRFAAPRLRVTNVPLNSVSLRIDGRDVGNFAAEQLEEGVELTEHVLPMSFGDRIAELIEMRNRLAFVRRRTLGFHAKGEPEPVKQAMTELMAVERELELLETELANANSHTIEVSCSER